MTITLTRIQLNEAALAVKAEWPALTDWHNGEANSRSSPNPKWRAAIRNSGWPFKEYAYANKGILFYVPTNWLKLMAEKLRVPWEQACTFTIAEPVRKAGRPKHNSTSRRNLLCTPEEYAQLERALNHMRNVGLDEFAKIIPS